jgi:hypothetical protein
MAEQKKPQNIQKKKPDRASELEDQQLEQSSGGVYWRPTKEGPYPDPKT